MYIVPLELACLLIGGTTGATEEDVVSSQSLVNFQKIFRPDIR